MKPSSSKAKGRRLQQWVRDEMRRIRPELEANDVTSRSTGAGGTDLILSPAAFKVFPLAVEAKNVERVNIWSAYAQACAHDDPGEPVVVIAKNRHKPLVVVDATWFLELLGET